MRGSEDQVRLRCLCEREPPGPLIRCRQTVELALPGAVPEIEPRLIECGYGEWEGQPLKSLAKQRVQPAIQFGRARLFRGDALGGDAQRLQFGQGEQQD